MDYQSYQIYKQEWLSLCSADDCQGWLDGEDYVRKVELEAMFNALPPDLVKGFEERQRQEVMERVQKRSEEGDRP